MPKKLTRRKSSALRETIMVLLAVISVGLLIVEVVNIVSPDTYPWMYTLDLIISVFFFGDFFLHFHVSPNKSGFFRRHIPDLIAAVPITSAVSAGLAFPVFSPLTFLHLFRFFRLILRIRILLEASSEYTRHSYLIYVATTAVFVLVSGATGFYLFEFGKNPHVNSFGDAIWWAIVTSTTIGYGDIYPVTTGGRVVAVIVMLVGITALGTFIAAVDSLFQSRRLKFLPRKR